jgi:hypothetical protein
MELLGSDGWALGTEFELNIKMYQVYIHNKPNLVCQQRRMDFELNINKFFKILMHNKS